jgi:hypothetical protein
MTLLVSVGLVGECNGLLENQGNFPHALYGTALDMLQCIIQPTIEPRVIKRGLLISTYDLPQLYMCFYV